MAMVGGRPKAQAAMGKAEAGAGMVGGGEAIWPVQQCCEAPGIGFLWDFQSISMMFL